MLVAEEPDDAAADDEVEARSELLDVARVEGEELALGEPEDDPDAEAEELGTTELLKGDDVAAELVVATAEELATREELLIAALEEEPAPEEVEAEGDALELGTPPLDELATLDALLGGELVGALDAGLDGALEATLEESLGTAEEAVAAIDELQKLFGPEYRSVRVWPAEGTDGWMWPEFSFDHTDAEST